MGLMCGQASTQKAIIGFKVYMTVGKENLFSQLTSQVQEI